MWRAVILSVLMGHLVHFSSAHLMEGLYCGATNCYDILNVTRESTKGEIGKVYRVLARKYHPDNRDTGDEEKFKIVANAYEILSNTEARNDYNYMLDNPEAYYQNYYRYYRRQGPKVDIRIVILSTITIISLAQYFVKKSRYNEAVNYFVTVPKYRNKAIEMVANDKEMCEVVKNAKKNKMSKADLRDLQEKQIRVVIEEKMDIRGSYEKPSVYDVLWVQIIISPYTFVKYIAWFSSWTLNFTILGKPYGDEEKLYLLRKNLGMGEHQFNAVEEELIDDYLQMELWKKENYNEWKQEQEEEMKLKMAQSNRYKSYRRWMKNNKSRITFDD